MDRLKNPGWLREQYETLQRSFGDIATELGTYPQRVRRAAIKAGIKPRSKETAQSIALNSGRAQHPTEGKKRSKEECEHISEGVAKSWAKASPETLTLRADKARQQWLAMTDEQRENLRRLAAAGVRRASKEGSKLEKSLTENLTKAGYKIEYHKEGLVPNIKLEVDLYIPSLSTAIEIDGPSHFLPIWGEEALAKTIRADLEKSGLIIHQGNVIIRVKYLSQRLTLSKKMERDLFNAVLAKLEQIKRTFPPKHERLIEIEVS